jgi:hypothetical protein
VEKYVEKYDVLDGCEILRQLVHGLSPHNQIIYIYLQCFKVSNSYKLVIRILQPSKTYVHVDSPFPQKAPINPKHQTNNVWGSVLEWLYHVISHYII